MSTVEQAICCLFVILSHFLVVALNQILQFRENLPLIQNSMNTYYKHVYIFSMCTVYGRDI